MGDASRRHIVGGKWRFTPDWLSNAVRGSSGGTDQSGHHAFMVSSPRPELARHEGSNCHGRVGCGGDHLPWSGSVFDRRPRVRPARDHYSRSFPPTRTLILPAVHESDTTFGLSARPPTGVEKNLPYRDVILNRTSYSGFQTTQ